MCIGPIPSESKGSNKSLYSFPHESNNYIYFDLELTCNNVCIVRVKNGNFFLAKLLIDNSKIQDPSTEESTATIEVNLEEQTITISFYDELDNMEREVFTCPFSKDTLIRLTEEYQRGSGVYNISLFLLTDRKV